MMSLTWAARTWCRLLVVLAVVGGGEGFAVFFVRVGCPRMVGWEVRGCGWWSRLPPFFVGLGGVGLVCLLCCGPALLRYPTHAGILR